MARHTIRVIQKMTAVFMLLLMISAWSMAYANAQVASAPLTRNVQTMNGMVRVWLSSLGSPSSLHLTIQGSYSAGGISLPYGASATVGFNTSSGQITLTCNGQTYHMGQAFALRRHSAGGSNGILIREARESRNPYPGDLSFEAVYTGTGYRLYVIAHIFIETYLYGVLPYEMGNSSHAEALKAQAVAARTYTVRMMKSRASGRYDVQDTTSDQVYRGTPSGNDNCVAAVDETKGIVLMYGGNYITTFYSSSNGGQTEIPRNGTSYGYMKVKDDPFDYDNPSSTVKSKTIYADLQSSANSSQLIALLKEKAIRSLQRSGYAATHENTFLQTLKAVTPHTPMYAEPSKLYTQMDFTMDVQTRTSSGLIATLTVAVTCDIFDELESVLAMGIQSMDNELWTVARSGSGFVLQARRYGHGMGMSQRGAMYMGKLGYTYDQILGFYYEGCTRVQHSFTSSILDPDTDDENITVEPPADLEETGSTGRVQLGSSESVLFIRSQKSYSAQVIGTASHGAQLKVLSNDGNWCFVRFGALDGYVPSASLLISGTPEETDTGATPIAGFVRVTANDFVNLRQSGSMSARITGTAPAGAILTLFETNGSWAKVQYNGLAAYANTGYLSSVMPHYPSSAEDEVATGTAVVSTADGGSVNLREQASLGSRVLTQVPYGAQVELLSEYGKWHKIRYQGWTGYMMSRFLLAKNEDENKPVPPDTVEGERAIVATEYGSLNMRARASAGSEILTTIPKGAYVVVEQHGDVWSAVWYEGWAGYVMTCYLAFENEEEQPEVSPQLQYATVHTPSGTLNLRALPRTGSQILGQIPPGTRVTVYEYASDWCRVNYNGTVGYVNSERHDYCRNRNIDTAFPSLENWFRPSDCNGYQFYFRIRFLFCWCELWLSSDNGRGFNRWYCRRYSWFICEILDENNYSGSICQRGYSNRFFLVVSWCGFFRWWQR